MIGITLSGATLSPNVDTVNVLLFAFVLPFRNLIYAILLLYYNIQSNLFELFETNISAMFIALLPIF